MNTLGCVLTEEEPMQTFCECGKPLKLWSVPSNHTALRIKWVPNGCGKEHSKSEDLVEAKKEVRRYF